MYGSPEPQKHRDSEKKYAASVTGVTLIEIPFWWDRSTESLAATIRKARPGHFLPLLDQPQQNCSKTTKFQLQLQSRLKMMLQLRQVHDPAFALRVQGGVSSEMALVDVEHWSDSVNDSTGWFVDLGRVPCYTF
jgi:hypothetical protein